MDKFRVGQKVRIVDSIYYPNSVSEIVTITGSREPYICIENGKMYLGYILSDGKASPEENLEPVYDGDEKSSWSESVWKPKKLIKE